MRWIEGLWLGRSVGTDEHIVGTATGIQLGRTCRWIPPAEAHESIFEQMRFTPWSQKVVATWDALRQEAIAKASQAEVAGSRLDPIPEEVEVPTGVLPSEQTPTSTQLQRSHEMQRFHAECGRTFGCSGCQEPPPGRNHTQACWERRAAYSLRHALQQEESIEPTGTMSSSSSAEAPHTSTGPSAQSMDVEPAEVTTRKRSRSSEMIEAESQDEQEQRLRPENMEWMWICQC